MVSKTVLGRFGALAAASLMLAASLPVSVVAATDSDGDHLSDRFERHKSLTSPHRKDSDRDGIPDGKEDPDQDGLTNRQEFIVGTHPRKADTDGDGTRDDHENADGDALWNRTEFRADTSPLRKDTDRDGLGDGKENPDRDGLTNRQEQDHGTHPRKADTDGDGYRDGVEVTAGTDPLDPTSFPGSTIDRPDPDPDADADTDTGLRPDTDPGADPGPTPVPTPTSAPAPTPTATAGAGTAPTVPGAPGCPIFPASNVWNQRIDGRSVAADSATMINAIGLDRGLHMDFGSFAGYGIPYQVVGASTPRSMVTFEYDEDSDHVGYPIPASPLIEGGSDAHILMVDRDACRLYELFAAAKVNGSWTAGSGATWDLRSNALRTEGWTSADAAGLPILPGLVRYDEVAARRHPACTALHDQPDAAPLHLPREALRELVHLDVAAADGPARPTQGDLRHVELLTAGAGHRGRAQALRDDPGRQRLALVHQRHERSALRRRRDARAGRRHRS